MHELDKLASLDRFPCQFDFYLDIKYSHPPLNKFLKLAKNLSIYTEDERLNLLIFKLVAN